MVDTGKDPNQSTTDQEDLGKGKRKKKQKNPSNDTNAGFEDTSDSESDDGQPTFKRPTISTPPPSLNISQPGTY